jgi:hypothetical protein
MFPHQFKSLLETFRSIGESLRSELSSIKETVKEQERTIRDASNAADQKRRELSGIIASAIESANKDVPSYEKNQRNKEYRQQRRVLRATGITAGATVLAFGAAAYYACVAKGQLDQMIEATKQTKRAADIAACALRQNQKQFTDTLEEMRAQTKAQQTASSVASDALHVSERAYISTGAPFVNWQGKALGVPLENKGHIPSGPISILVSEVTTVQTLHPNEVPSYFADACWHRTPMETLDTGASPVSISVGARYFDAEKIKSGLESFQVAIDVSYNDGFPHAPIQHWTACAVSTFQNGSILSNPCAIGGQMKSIVKASGYPDPRRACPNYPN